MKPTRLDLLAQQGNARPGAVLELVDGQRVEVAWPSWGHGLDAKSTDSAFVRALGESFTGELERGPVYWLRPETLIAGWTPPPVFSPASAPIDPRAFADVDPLRAGGDRGLLL